MTRLPLRTALALGVPLALLAGLSACSDDESVATTTTTTTTAAGGSGGEGGSGGGGGSTMPGLISVAIGPEDPFIAAGFPAQLTATGTYDDGSTEDLTATVTWSSSNEDLVSVSESGLASFVAVGGPVTMTATAAGTGLSADVTIPARKLAFVASVSGSAVLATWTDAGGETGLDAGDAICQARAAAAGLTGNYKAWLSDGTDDAYCRIAGFAGKRSANCGQAQLPTLAGPWLRTDGFPFADGLEALTNHAVQVPLRFTETGEAAPPVTRSFTGTLSDGSLGAGSCGNWASAAAAAVNAGDSDWLAVGWGATSGNCSNTARLMCFETGAGEALPNYVQMGKVAFVTSAEGSGKLETWADAGAATGVAAGDAICNARAQAAGLTGSFKAWLSTSTVNAIDRLTSDGPWITSTGVPIAASKADLSDGKLFTAINYTDEGDYLSANVVWTGTNSTAEVAASHCDDWGSELGGDNGMVAAANSAREGWTQAFEAPCDATGRLYCFED